MFERLSSETRINGGSSDTDSNALAVMPCVCSSYWAVRTVTPLAKRPNALRNCLVSIAWFTNCRETSLAAVLHYNTNIVRIDQVRHSPAVQIVFRHALLGEALVLGRLA